MNTPRWTCREQVFPRPDCRPARQRAQCRFNAAGSWDGDGRSDGRLTGSDTGLPASFRRLRWSGSVLIFALLAACQPQEVSRTPVPEPRSGDGWSWRAQLGKHAEWNSGRRWERLDAWLTYEGHEVRFQGTLLTPIGTFGHRRSPPRPALQWNGPQPVSDARSTDVPIGGTATAADIARGHVPSDGTSRPAGVPADWVHLAGTRRSGWVDPGLLVSPSLLRALQSPEHSSFGWEARGSSAEGWTLWHYDRPVERGGRLVTPLGSFLRECLDGRWIWRRVSDVSSFDEAESLYPPVETSDPVGRIHSPSLARPRHVPSTWVHWSDDDNPPGWTSPDQLVGPRPPPAGIHPPEPSWTRAGEGSATLGARGSLDLDPPSLTGHPSRRPDLLVQGTDIVGRNTARIKATSSPCFGPEACSGGGGLRSLPIDDLRIGERFCVKTRESLVLVEVTGLSERGADLHFTRWMDAASPPGG